MPLLTDCSHMGYPKRGRSEMSDASEELISLYVAFNIACLTELALQNISKWKKQS